MKVTIKTFAALKTFFPVEVTQELAENSTISDLIAQLKILKPGATPILDHCMVAVAEEMTNKTYMLKNGEEVLIMPPASGG